MLLPPRRLMMLPLPLLLGQQLALELLIGTSARFLPPPQPPLRGHLRLLASVSG